MRFTIITNNPQVNDKYASLTTFINEPPIGVLTAVRNAVHKGAVLISHPQSGSLRPGVSPYKSVLLSEPQDALHFTSLQLIEEALTVFRHKASRQNMTYDDNTRTDFQILDLDLVESALTSLSPTGGDHVSII